MKLNYKYEIKIGFQNTFGACLVRNKNNIYTNIYTNFTFIA